MAYGFTANFRISYHIKDRIAYLAPLENKQLNKNYGRYLAELISALGHPILLGVVAAVFVNFKEFDFEKALNLTLLILAFCVIPLVLYLVYKIKKGDYKDFDVSEQKKRNSLYPILIGLQCMLLAVLYFLELSWLFKAGLVSCISLLISSYLLNFYLKVSLHTSFSFFLSILLIKVENTYAFTMLFFAVLIAYSRVYLKRHTVPEVAAGMALGLFSGYVFHCLLNFN